MKPKLAKKNEPEYFLRLDTEAAEEGPYTLETLRAKAGAGEIVRETWFRLAQETDYRQLSDDAALAADLWPEKQPFNPEDHTVDQPAASASEADRGGTLDQTGADVGQLLGDNVRRDRQVLPREEAKGFDWRGLSSLGFVALRWVLAVLLAVWGLRLWLLLEGAEREKWIVDFLWGFVAVALAIVLTLPETLRWVVSPFASLVDTLLEGTGGGKQADFWTADSLMEQGEYRLAMVEYRRVAIQHPREIEAYIKGIRAARALDNQKEVDRFRELALKNLKTEQDRNLFLSSIERLN